MYDFDNMTLKEIREIDLKIVREEVLEKNKDRLYYDEDCQAWFIGGEEIVDELWYDPYTIINPKELIGYIEEIIEDEMKIKK